MAPCFRGLVVLFLSVSLRKFEAVEVSDQLFQQLVDRVQALETRNEHLEEKVKVLESPNKRQTNEGPIAFTARIDPVTVDHVKPNQKIVFGTFVTNIGNAYNNMTGVFTAPLSGIYIFSCSLLDDMARADGSGTMLHAEIVQNGKVLARVFGHAEGTSYRDQGAQTVFVNVQKGDLVWVRSIDNSDLKLGGEKYSTFSGFLLWQM